MDVLQSLMNDTDTEELFMVILLLKIHFERRPSSAPFKLLYIYDHVHFGLNPKSEDMKKNDMSKLSGSRNTQPLHVRNAALRVERSEGNAGKKSLTVSRQALKVQEFPVNSRALIDYTIHN